MIRIALLLSALSTAATSAQAPNVGDGVVTPCVVEQAMLTESALRIECDRSAFSRPELDDEVLVEFTNSDRRWLAARTLEMMDLVPRDDQDRPILTVNVMFQGSGRPARLMDVRADYGDTGAMRDLIALRNPTGAISRDPRPGSRGQSTNPTGGTATPQNGQGGVIHCRVLEIMITESTARFECDRIVLDRPGFDYRAEIDHSQSSNRRWLLERTLDLISIAPAERGAPAVEFNVMFQGSGRAGRIMDARTAYE